MPTMTEKTRRKLAAAIAPLAAMSPERGWAVVRERMNNIARERGEWGGAPIPVEHVRLKMEPRYPFSGLSGAKFGEQPKPQGPQDYTLLNTIKCLSRPLTAFVCREANGKSRVYFGSNGPGERLRFWINTLGVAAGQVWNPAVESRALEKLKDLITGHAFNCYMLTGMFLETSKRSGVQYLFRKLRPTIALRPDDRQQMRVLAVLCLHSLGFYEETWAGVMCPTDDVISHLMLMRGDEHWFWKKANHHAMDDATAGI